MLAAGGGLQGSCCVCRSCPAVSDMAPCRAFFCCCGAGAACPEDGLRLRGLLAALTPPVLTCRQCGTSQRCSASQRPSGALSQSGACQFHCMTAAEHGLLSVTQGAASGRCTHPKPVCTDCCAAKERDAGQCPSDCCAAMGRIAGAHACTPGWPVATQIMPGAAAPCQRGARNRGQGRHTPTRLA